MFFLVSLKLFYRWLNNFFISSFFPFIEENQPWEEISGVSFSDTSEKVSIYLTVPGVSKEMDKSRAVVWVSESSLEVRIVGVEGKNWVRFFFNI